MSAGTESYIAPPQNGMQNISFANSDMAFNGDKKSMALLHLEECWLNRYSDYVFVDEHNRHKRLKGMQLW